MAILVTRRAASGRPCLPRGVPWPRRTARLRLTFLYGGLFLGCGTILLAVSYLLVEQAIAPGGDVNQHGLDQAVRGGPGRSSPLTTYQLHMLALGLGKEIASSDLRQVLIDAPIALAIVTAVAVALGWLAAGRILRPLATITAAARRISASSLHQRLALPGPDDELKALGDTLDELFARLQAAFEAQRHFVANASHELRTPLTRERAMLQVALDDPGTTAETWRGVAAEVLASNAEQESLIETLLTLASSQGGLGELETVDLAAVTGEVLRAARPEATRHGLSLHAVAGPAPLLGDKLLAGRLVANLIGNAVRHNVAGGKVEVSITARDGRAVLAVANTGPVIPPEAIGRLFQPFRRLDGRQVRHVEGHGLGLSIVHAIAAAHGAAITAGARHGGGLSIEVTFPAIPDEPGSASVIPRSASTADQGYSRKMPALLGVARGSAGRCARARDGLRCAQGGDGDEGGCGPRAHWVGGSRPRLPSRREPGGAGCPPQRRFVSILSAECRRTRLGPWQPRARGTSRRGRGRTPPPSPGRRQAPRGSSARRRRSGARAPVAACGRARGESSTSALPSLSARVPVPFMAPIGGSKAALASFSDSLRLELSAWGIPVTVIEPGGTDTAIFQKAETAARATLGAADPAKVALYSDQLAVVAKAAVRQKLGPTEAVAKTIVAAVEARKPKRRYAAGSGTAVFGVLAHVPASLRE